MSIIAYGFSFTQYKLTEEIIAKYNQELEFHKSSQIFQVMIDISYTTKRPLRMISTKQLGRLSQSKKSSSNIDPMSIYQDILMESKVDLI